MEQRKGQTKRQHYVPRFLLRNFSLDPQRRMICVRTRERTIVGASMRDQCYSDYLYGSDGSVEGALARLEGIVAPLLSNPSAERLAKLSTEEVERLIWFIGVQEARTKSTEDFRASVMDRFFRQLVRVGRDSGLGPEVSEEDLRELTFKDGNVLPRALFAAGQAIPILLDLELKVLVSRRAPRFVIGDHPVAAYNQHAEHHPDLSKFPSTRAWAHRGLQIFLPVSPEISLALYDPETYQYQAKSRVCGVGPNDVQMLNKLQVAHSRSCFYFSSTVDIPDAALDELIRCQRDTPGQNEPEFRELYLPDRPKFPAIQFRKREVRLGTKLSVARPTDHNRYRGTEMPVRSLRRLQEVRRHAERLDRHLSATSEAEPSEG